MIGVLSVQGNFNNHIQCLNYLNIDCKEIKEPFDLNECSGLIIPGGESSVIMKMIYDNKLYEPIIRFSKKYAVIGFCAGLIVLSKTAISKQRPLGILDIEIERNSYGSQFHSFSKNIYINSDIQKSVDALFIRAPRITNYNSNIEILATYEESPILIRHSKAFGCSFHSEFKLDNPVHRLFINTVYEKN